MLGDVVNIDLNGTIRHNGPGLLDNLVRNALTTLTCTYVFRLVLLISFVSIRGE